MDSNLSQPPPAKCRDSKASLSVVSLAALVVAGMIGSGVYSTTGFSLASLYSPELVMLAWCVAGAIAICGAISYGELASRLLESGGEYLYLTRFVHPLAGFLAGWVSALAGFTAAAAYAAVVFEAHAIPDGVRPDWLPQGAISVSLVAVLTMFHAIGIRTGTLSQNIVVLIKLMSLTVFVAWAFFLWPSWFVNQPDVSSPATAIEAVVDGETVAGDEVPGSVSWLIFATSTMWISFSFTGFNSPIYVAEESRTGLHGIRRSMIIGTLLVTVLYLVLNYVFLYSSDPAAIAGKEEVALICADQLGSLPMKNLLRVLICLGLASSVSSMLMMGPRVYRKMADDGVFPSSLVPSGEQFRLAIAIQAAAVVLLVLIAGHETLLHYLSMTLSLCSAGTVATLLFCRRDRSGQEFKKPGAVIWAAASIYCVASIVIAVLSCFNAPSKATGTVVTIVVGVGVFLFLKPATARPST